MELQTQLDRGSVAAMPVLCKKANSDLEIAPQLMPFSLLAWVFFARNFALCRLFAGLPGLLRPGCLYEERWWLRSNLSFRSLAWLAGHGSSTGVELWILARHSSYALRCLLGFDQVAETDCTNSSRKLLAIQWQVL